MVAGVKYELVFDAGLSTCANDGTSHTQEACPVSSTSWYTVVVVDQAWMDPRCTLLSHAMEASPPAPQQCSIAADCPTSSDSACGYDCVPGKCAERSAEADDEGWPECS